MFDRIIRQGPSYPSSQVIHHNYATTPEQVRTLRELEVVAEAKIVERLNIKNNEFTATIVRRLDLGCSAYSCFVKLNGICFKLDLKDTREADLASTLEDKKEAIRRMLADSIACVMLDSIAPEILR